MNLSRRTDEKHNLKLAEEALRWADRLKAAHVIFHPGVGGAIKETARQLRLLADPRVLIENKPYHTMPGDRRICTGHSVAEIEYVMKMADVGLCLDIGHAFAAARAVGDDQLKRVERLISFKPAIIHLTDGLRESRYDNHAHIGEGNFDIPGLLAIFPREVRVTIETAKDFRASLSDFQRDIRRLRACERIRQ